MSVDLLAVGLSCRKLDVGADQVAPVQARAALQCRRKFYTLVGFISGGMHADHTNIVRLQDKSLDQVESVSCRTCFELRNLSRPKHAFGRWAEQVVRHDLCATRAEEEDAEKGEERTREWLPPPRGSRARIELTNVTLLVSQLTRDVHLSCLL